MPEIRPESDVPQDLSVINSPHLLVNREPIVIGQHETEDQPTPVDEDSSREHIVTALARSFHEKWRQSGASAEGGQPPSVKRTTDPEWIAKHDTDQVNIRDTDYDNLPTDWQAKNKAAAAAIIKLVEKTEGPINLVDPAQRSQLGAAIHNAWLGRNPEASGGALDVPFDELPPHEQQKDIDQIALALEVLKDDPEADAGRSSPKSKHC